MPAKIARFSILRLMVIVSVVAIDCGFMRATWDSGHTALLLMTLPILNFMLPGVPKMKRGHVAQHFWIGFVAAGLSLFGIILFLNWYDREFLFRPILRLFEIGWISEDTPKHLVMACGCVVAIYTLPQLLLSWFVGWLNARFRVVIKRRPRPSEVFSSTSVVES